jgi:hypothetical protein
VAAVVSIVYLSPDEREKNTLCESVVVTLNPKLADLCLDKVPHRHFRHNFLDLDSLLTPFTGTRKSGVWNLAAYRWYEDKEDPVFRRLVHASIPVRQRSS